MSTPADDDDFIGGTKADRAAVARSLRRDPFITVQLSITGWMAVHVWWNPDLGGFYEPWATGLGKYRTREEAVAEATDWAKSEGLELNV